MASLTPEQRRNLQTIRAVGRRLGASPKAMLAAVEAGLVESNLQNLSYGDRDSLGVFQQRPSQGWGSPSQVRDVAHAAEQFFQRAIPLSSKYGNAGALAQAVQRSAFPGRYNQRSGLARTLLAGSGGTAGTTSGSGGSSGSSGSSGSTRTVTTVTPGTPGVDNRVARAALIQSFLSDTNADPVDFAVQANALKDIAPTPETRTSRTVRSASAKQSTTGAAASSMLPKGKSKLLELIHNTGPGKPGFAVKNGQKVNGPQFYSGVWAGHADHVHVAAGPKTIVQLGKLAQKMGLNVGENPHFGGVDPVHVPGSYHYKGEAIDVSGDPGRMNAYARAVERLYGIGGKR